MTEFRATSTESAGHAGTTAVAELQKLAPRPSKAGEKRQVWDWYTAGLELHGEALFAEFDFRYNNRVALGVDDHQRALRLLEGVVGRRLTYQTTHQ